MILAPSASGSPSAGSWRWRSTPARSWDWIEPNELDRALDLLAASGRSVYAALEDWEITELRTRLAGSAAIAALRTPVFQARDREAIDAYVFLLRQGLTANGN